MVRFIEATTAALLGLAQVDATSMKIDFLRLTNVRTDPIINQNGLSAHVHSFFGASRAAPSTTYADLRSASGNTGNIEENKSLYWHPTIYKYNKNTQKYTIQDTSQFSTYYVWETGQTTAYPDGFKMIGGGAPDQSYMQQRAECVGPGSCPNGDCESWNDFFPATACDELEMSMRMPNCWDGVNLDSADHRSHVAYSDASDPQGACPNSHPVKIPQIRIFTRIMPYTGGIHVFSDGSGLFHSDYFSGWEATFLQSVLDNCQNPSFEAMPTSWCENHVTFRDAPKNHASNETDLDKLASLQPNPPFDPSFITNEAIDNVSCLPGSAGCTTGTTDQPATTTTTGAGYNCCVENPCPDDTDACWEPYEQNCNHMGSHSEIWEECKGSTTQGSSTQASSSQGSTTQASTTTQSGLSDNAFCAEHGAAYAEYTKDYCTNGNYVGAQNGEFCTLLVDDFASLCNTYQSCQQSGANCNRVDSSSAAPTTTASTTTASQSTTTNNNSQSTTNNPQSTTNQPGNSCPKNTFSSVNGVNGQGFTQNPDGSGTADGITAPPIKQYVAMEWLSGQDPAIPGDANGQMGTYSTDGSHFYIAGNGLEGAENQWANTKTEGVLVKVKPCDSSSAYSNHLGATLSGAGNNCATKYVWGTKLGGNNNKWDQVLSVKEDPTGSFVIAVGASYISSTNSRTSRTMYKLDAANGNIIWSKMMPTTESDVGYYSGYETVAFTEDGSVIAGGFNFPKSFPNPLADADGGVFTFKSGGQVSQAAVLFERYTAAAINANSQSAADSLSWTVGGAIAWRYQHGGDGSEAQDNGSMKNCRVFKDSGVEKVIGVGGVKGDIHIVKADDGSRLSFQKHGDNIGQMADVEPIIVNGVFTGYAESGHLGKEVVGTGGMPDGIKNGQIGTVYHGQFNLFDANHNLIKQTEFNNMAGGLYMYAGTPVPADVAVRTECWGIAKAMTQDGQFDGFYMGCGQGAEPDACGQSYAIQSVQNSCQGLKRQAWRSVTLRFDLSGNIGWYRMDNYYEGSNEVGTSANEYVASHGNKVISMIDEGFGFGVTEYIDPTVVTDCSGPVSTTQGPSTTQGSSTTQDITTTTAGTQQTSQSTTTLPYCTGTTTAPVTTTKADESTTQGEQTTKGDVTTENPKTDAPSTTQGTTTTASTTSATTTTTSTTTASTAAPTGCNSFGSTLVQSDGSIRMLDSSRSEWCAFKKYSSYRVNDEIWFKTCDVANANANKAGKYRFSFDSSTGLVSSAGALDFMQLNLCFRISSLTRFGKQRVLLANCDANDQNQVFQVINGRLHVQGETRICLGFEEHRVNAQSGIAMTVQDCYPSVFGSNAGCDGASLVDSDQAIYPTGLTDKCLFKRYSGYAAQDEIWVDTCAATHQNVNKAGKYQWTYDSVTGLISSVGALSYQDGIAYCMRINNKNRFYKQRVKLARCDSTDELQQMDYSNGRIYARANNRLCAGFEYNKLAADGKTAFIFSTCYPNDFVVDFASSRKRRQANDFVEIPGVNCIDPNAPTTGAPTTTQGTTTAGINCCNADPCPSDSNQCWSNWEGACGDYETAMASIYCSTTQGSTQTMSTTTEATTTTASTTQSTSQSTTQSTAQSTTTNNVPTSTVFGGMRGIEPTLSGFSAGGYMTSLMHTIHSATFKGAAPIAGGAYASPYVNQGQKGTRKRRNAENNHRVKRQANCEQYGICNSVNLAQQFSDNNQIDNISNLENSKVFVLHASNDDAVPVFLAWENVQYYGNVSNTITVQTDIGRNFFHSFPDSNNEAATILNFLYSTTVQGGDSESAQLTSFSMSEFCPNGNCGAVGVGNTGLYAASSACRNAEIQCRVHVYLHGCGGNSQEGTSHYAGIAEANDFIAVFPQTNGDAGACWNVGWRADSNSLLENTATGHLTYANPQAVTLKAMVDALTGGSGGNGGNNENSSNAPSTTQGTTTTQATTTTTQASTSSNSADCCNADPCPNDSNQCWGNWENICGEYETAMASCQGSTTQGTTTQSGGNSGYSHNCAAGEDSACQGNNDTDACWADFWCVCEQWCDSDDKDRK